MGVVGYVFGYGSLAAAGLAGLNRTPRREGFVADLEGFERGWGVAMDNTRTVPGYKCYVDRTGSRPDVCVAFLDLTPATTGRVNGVCLPVDEAALAALDDRERNYERVDVSDRLPCAEPVWTYLGSVAGRGRLAHGRARGKAVIHEGYLAAVTRGFRALGPQEWAACAPSLAPRGLAVRALTRRELA
jgi:hypothetical protein